LPSLRWACAGHRCNHSQGSHPRDPCPFQLYDRTTDVEKSAMKLNMYMKALPNRPGACSQNLLSYGLYCVKLRSVS
jgi:hypothetical protein